ncbi:MAG: tRNA-dependent cyclodipeptide synthase [Patescibacteria group bacterium]
MQMHDATLDIEGIKRIDRFNQQVCSEGWRMAVDQNADAVPSRLGLKYLYAGKDVLLAMCLNNGYYHRENIYRMLRFALTFSNRMQIFTTDGPAKHNYEALGKVKSKIPAITRLARNRLRNQCMDALGRINAELPQDEQRSITFMEWEHIYADQAYVDSYKYLKDLYSMSTEFRTDINDTSEQVLLNRIGIEKEVKAVLSIGIEYVIEELAFILAYRSLGPASKPIRDHGHEGFSYLYYEPWPVFEKLIRGEYDGMAKEGIGFVVAKIEEIG